MAQADTAFDFNKRLGVGVNLGNALDAPKEGEWGVVLQSDYFKLIKAAGFKHIRLPVRWSSHTSAKAPYTIDPKFIARVDWAIKEARANGLKIVLNMHHYEEFESDFAKESAKFLAMWKQISEHLSNEPADLAFELYNEPAKNIDAAKWNSIFPQALKIVRVTNPNRCIVVGPDYWNSIDHLNSLVLPASDKNLLVTVHYYQPFRFTHQGASWVGAESNSWVGQMWTGSQKETTDIKNDFGKAEKWGRENNRPIYLGEFGAYSKADMVSRANWTRAIKEQALSHGFSCAYWEFCSGFGLYDPDRKEWRKPLLESLQLK